VIKDALAVQNAGAFAVVLEEFLRYWANSLVNFYIFRPLASVQVTQLTGKS
jgi:hypothetical protein